MHQDSEDRSHQRLRRGALLSVVMKRKQEKLQYRIGLMTDRYKMVKASFLLQICNRSSASLQFCQLNLLRDQFAHVDASVTMFILRQWPKEKGSFLNIYDSLVRDLCRPHLRPISPFADKGAAAAGSLSEHNPVRMLRSPLHKLKIEKKNAYLHKHFVSSLYLDAGVILPVSHRLLEQGFMDAATSEKKVTSEMLSMISA